jgi:hypothetical protein
LEDPEAGEDDPDPDFEEEPGPEDAVEEDPEAGVLLLDGPLPALDAVPAGAGEEAPDAGAAGVAAASFEAGSPDFCSPCPFDGFPADSDCPGGFILSE